ncbi:MAG: hypothetical protein AB7P23_05665 [Amphiplicatus sp.]
MANAVFSKLIMELDGGGAEERLSERLDEIVSALKEHGGKAELKLQLKLEMNAFGRIDVDAKIAAKVPRGGVGRTTFVPGPKGQLDLFTEGPDGKTRAAGDVTIN